ncbi:MAG: polyprenyl synthetase family protein [Thermoplasmata archaeon]|nr:MAG: polyprenyl synthetase family protein [Thermoplasmata archaeon]
MYQYKTDGGESFQMALHKRIILVNEEMNRILSTEMPYLMPMQGLNGYSDPVTHILWSGGKRIRPILCMFACDAVGGDEKKVLPTAAGLEFLHAFTLIHDDIMDDADMRRGGPTVHAIWGVPMAITAGDTLYSLAFRAFSKNSEVEGIDDARVKYVMELATEKCLNLAKGQAMDILFENQPDVEIEDYLRMVKLKTAALLELALQAGGVLGGGSKNEIDALEELGGLMGTAFQIQDDIIDVEGVDTGKPLGTDLKKGKKTIVLLHALKHVDSTSRDRIINFIENSSEDDLMEVIDIIKSTDSVSYAKQLVKETLEEAEEVLSNLEDRQGTHNLKAMIGYLMRRNK